MRHLRPKRRRQNSVDFSKLQKLVPTRQAVGSILASVFVVLGSIAILLRLRAVSEGARALVTDGKRVFSPGQLLSDQAHLGLMITVGCFVAIVLAALFGRRRSSTVVMTAVFAAVSLTAVVFAFATYQQYRGFINLS